ncbi:OmpA family protein [Paraburkholderia adhaesiva]|uniref:OmpA family protein n=1 Tax=Paraburkholderia adhaesiva TaxID=2883244 RepID=UPI001F2A6E58|nr:OmpA family protein [Paraburkholderia adhaesiva]
MGTGAAHVYVDGELEGALMPDGYTRFCVTKGAHSIEAYIGDAPLYAGKFDPKTQATLQGGATYFIGVSKNGTGGPVPYRRDDAERLLQTSHEATYIINRASAVVPCRYRPAPVAPVVEAPTRFELNASVLFDTDRGDVSSLKPEGRNELKKIAEQILLLPPGSVAGVTVVGHADPMGSRSHNQTLSEQRARTVGAVLSQYGLTRSMIRTVGMGSDEPVVNCPSKGARSEVALCNAPNRRVEIKVEHARPVNGTNGT